MSVCVQRLQSASASDMRAALIRGSQHGSNSGYGSTVLEEIETL